MPGRSDRASTGAAPSEAGRPARPPAAGRLGPSRAAPRRPSYGPRGGERPARHARGSRGLDAALGARPAPGPRVRARAPLRLAVRVEHRALRADRALGDEAVVAAEQRHARTSESSGSDTMRPMRTVVISDLHLGAPERRRRGARAARRASPHRCDQRAPTGSCYWATWSSCASGRSPRRSRSPGRRSRRRASARRPASRVMLVPGNHDHAFAEPWLARPAAGWLDALAPETQWPVDPATEPSAGSRRWMPDVELSSPTRAPPARRRLRDPRALPGPSSDDSAPGVDRGVRDGARHGPRQGRALGRGLRGDHGARSTRSTRAWRRVRPPASLSRGGSVSRDVWRRASDNGRPRIGRLPARPRDDPGRRGRPERPRSRAVQRHAHRRGAAPRRPAGDGARGGVLAPARPARDLRPYPPAWPAAGRRAGRVDDALRHAAVEHRQLATARARSSRPAGRARTGPAPC